MKRRTFLTSATAATTGLAGCLGGSEPTDENPDDGYPAESLVESTPEPSDVDTSSFDTLSVGDVDVPLVAVDVAHNWFQRREARFADARGQGQYEQSHITGAVLSTARRVEGWEQPRDGPTTDWPDDEKIVCYCGCPHHLSSLRAGEFIAKGYEEVYAIDEGFFAWRDSDYPVESADANQQSFRIQGRTDPADAGGYAWASHEASDQHEAAPIADDGRYQMTLHFSGLTSTAPINLRTPSYDLTAPLSELTETVVTAP